MREAYRLNRHLLGQNPEPVDIAFIYVAPKLTDYRAAENAIRKILSRVAAKPVSQPAPAKQEQP